LRSINELDTTVIIYMIIFILASLSAVAVDDLS